MACRETELAGNEIDFATSDFQTLFLDAFDPLPMGDIAGLDHGELLCSGSEEHLFTSINPEEHYDNEYGLPLLFDMDSFDVDTTETIDPYQLAVEPLDQSVLDALPSQSDPRSVRVPGSPDTAADLMGQGRPQQPIPKARPRIPKEAKAVLDDCFNANPSPKPSALEGLARLTGLTCQRVKTWFSNKRSRKDVHGAPLAPHDLNSNSANEPMELTPETLTALIGQIQGDPQGRPNPMESYLASSWEDEPVLITAVQIAVWAGLSLHTSSSVGVSLSVGEEKVDELSDPSLDCDLRDRIAQPFYSTKPDSDNAIARLYYDEAPWGSGRSVQEASPMAKTARRASSISFSIASSVESLPASLESRYSSASYTSLSSSANRGRRRGLKRYPDQYVQTDVQTEPASEINHGPFFCTFCWKPFLNKYEWSRHEDTHAMQNTWICCFTEQTDMDRCPFCDCDYIGPKEYHLEWHAYFSCMARPEEDRTFYRKDQFLQHLRNVHKITDGNKRNSMQLADLWHQQPPSLSLGDPALHCGFCGLDHPTWKSRTEHVAKHFSEEFLDQYAWWPGRLSTGIAKAIEQINLEGDFWRCLNCRAEFPSPKLHPYCQVWSCRFLQDFRTLIRCPTEPQGKHFCNLCIRDVSLSDGESHFKAKHKYRDCKQQIYWSAEAFKFHLVVEHESFGFHGIGLFGRFVHSEFEVCSRP